MKNNKLIGITNERLTVIEELEPRITPNGTKDRIVLCKCKCGKIKTIAFKHIRSGATKSCGCLNSEKTSKRSTVHGHSVSNNGRASKVYECWKHMIRRCYNSCDKSYKNYGGRGIIVCERWHSFLNFLEDMGEPLSHQSIDRIDVNGNYTPENCRWADAKLQANNRRSSSYITYNGKTMTETEWGETTGLGRSNIHNRNIRGWTPEEIFTIPLGGTRKPSTLTK